ncbi:hypothetical protein BDF22DRAFT_731816 [Syncephalis plumigaleata]|nr:hypothetical protein BDF22DRAFT_731816 [Syncephalis plumigaleata]
MQFRIDLISAAIAAVLLVTSIEPTTGINWLQKKEPEYYEEQRLGIKGAFGEKELTLLEKIDVTGIVHYLRGKWGDLDVTVTCAPRGPSNAEMVHSMYSLMGRLPRLSERAYPGIQYVAFPHTGFEIFGKYCHVTRAVCDINFAKYLGLLEKEKRKGIISLIPRTLIQLVNVITMMKELKLAYKFEPKSICFDTNRNLVLLRYDNIIQAQGATMQDLEPIDDALRSVLRKIFRRQAFIGDDMNAVNHHVDDELRLMGYTNPPTYVNSGVAVPAYDWRNAPPRVQDYRNTRSRSPSPLPLYEHLGSSSN